LRVSVRVRQGLILKQLRTGISGGWRRPFGWLASYALVLQLVLSAFGGAQVSAQAAEGNWSFFEICYGKGASSGELPEGVPAKHASKCSACVLAAAGGTALTPEAIVVAAPSFVTSDVVWNAQVENLARVDTSSSQRQRAPPFSA